MHSGKRRRPHLYADKREMPIFEAKHTGMNDLTKRRALAWIIDMLASALVLYIIGHMTPIRLHVAGWLSLSTSLQCTYLVCRDCFAGASPGRRLMNIRVANEHTGLMPSLRDCIVRNLVLLCISPVEAIVLLFSTDGKRLGDRLCHTRVTSLDVLPPSPPVSRIAVACVLTLGIIIAGRMLLGIM